MWDWFGSVWHGVTETVSDGMGLISSTTDTAGDVMAGVQDISSSLKETTLNAYETANAEETLAGQRRTAGIVKTVALVGGGAVLILILIKALK